LQNIDRENFDDEALIPCQTFAPYGNKISLWRFTKCMWGNKQIIELLWEYVGRMGIKEST